MTTFLDRWWREPNLQKYTGKNHFSIQVDFGEERKQVDVDVEWTFHLRPVRYDIEYVYIKGTNKDIWDELSTYMHGRIKGRIDSIIAKWSKEVGIVHPYNNKVFIHPITGEW